MTADLRFSLTVLAWAVVALLGYLMVPLAVRFADLTGKGRLPWWGRPWDNDEDGIFGHPDAPKTRVQARMWLKRNPCHNFSYWLAPKQADLKIIDRGVFPSNWHGAPGDYQALAMDRDGREYFERYWLSTFTIFGYALERRVGNAIRPGATVSEPDYRADMVFRPLWLRRMGT